MVSKALMLFVHAHTHPHPHRFCCAGRSRPCCETMTLSVHAGAVLLTMFFCPPSGRVSSSALPTQRLSSPADWSACDDTVRPGNTKLSHDRPASLLQHAAHGYVGGPSSGHGKTTVKPNSPAIRIHRPHAPSVAAALHKLTRGARES